MKPPKISVVLSLRERKLHLAERDAYTHLQLSITAWFLLFGYGLSFTYCYAEQAIAVDDARAQSAGIRKLASDHLVLYTDVASSPEVDRLPSVFDKAVPLWAAYFGVGIAKTATWQPHAFLISDRRRFAALGLMPPGYDDFANGVTLGSDMWLHDQPTDYYRRHLLLHEGTHAFMIAFLGGCGPGWYMEGTAELLGTHQLDEKIGQLTLGVMPRSREEVPMLGRIKLIDDAIADKRVLTLQAVMQLNNRKQLGNEAYAWCWAAAKLLDSHSRYRDRFRQLRTIVQEQDFNDTVRRRFANDWADLNTEWQAYIATLDYGYDYERMAINFETGKPLSGEPHHATVATDRGWQSSGVWLDASKSYEITAKGRYQIAVERMDGTEKAWSCEPGGVTIEYYNGRPLGILLGAIDSREERATTGSPSFAAPLAIGLHALVKPAASGTLYLRINDGAGKLDDNQGTLSVTIQPAR